MVAMVTFLSITWRTLHSNSYAGRMENTLKLHQELLSDRPRTLVYQTAVQANADYLKDKIIVDIGCGTGILSMMCAKHAKPKKVYAVEVSTMAEMVEKIVTQNNLSDVITVIHDYAEELDLKEKVDLIISEWMGTMLLFEMMIESVILARDKILKEDGMIWPSHASLFLVPCSAHAKYSTSIEFWDQQYGFDFSALKPLAKKEFLEKPIHNHNLSHEDCLSQEQEIIHLDMKTVTVADLEFFRTEFCFPINKAGPLHGFCSWFVVDFAGLATNVGKNFLSTGPDSEVTHWKQTLFLLDEPVRVNKGDIIRGSFDICRHPEWRRHLQVAVRFTVHSQDSGIDEEKISTVEGAEYKKLFRVWR